MAFIDRDDIDELLDKIVENKASDLHLKPGRKPLMRVNGSFMQVPGYNVLMAGDLDIILEVTYKSTVGPSSVQSMEDLDFSYEPSKSRNSLNQKRSRYRVNASLCSTGIRMVFRQLPSEPPSFAEIGMPEECIRAFKDMEQGLILVTGATGSGKSTTLASGVKDLLQEKGDLHIITLENPIEFTFSDFESDNSLITQRELGRHMQSFTHGLKSALRQDPEIILVGELRDLDTMRLAMEGAETGHLVLSTVHTTDVPATISRIVKVFPTEEQSSVQVQLISSLRLICCQILIKGKHGGRVAAREYLTFTPEIRTRLIGMNSAEIYSELYNITRTSGVSMSASIKKLYEDDLISEYEYNKNIKMLQEE